MSRSVLFSAAAALAVCGAAGAETFDADVVVIENVVGALQVRTSDRTDVEVVIEPGAGVIGAPTARMSAGRLIVEGADRYRNRECRGDKNNPSIRVGRRGRMLPLADYPRVVIEAPRDVALEVDGGVVFGEAGDLAAADISIDGCGDFDVGDVAGVAVFAINGSGDLEAGDVGSADVGINGSGDIRLGHIAGGADIVINGSGDIRAASVNGPADFRIRGSGDVAISDGRADPFEASIMGSGDIRFGGTAADPRVSIFGSGDVRIGSMEGSLRASGFGSGDVDIGG